MNISYSKINDFNTCPKKYQLIHIDKKLPEEKQNIYSAFGTAIHYAIEQTINKDFDLDLTITYFKNKFDELFDEIPLTKSQLIFKEEWYYKGKQMLTYFYNNIYDVVKEGVIETEKYFSYEIDKDIFLNGLIDIIFKNEKKEIELWDWKTGKKMPKKDNFQLRIYALCYYKLFGEVPSNIRYIFLKNNTENQTCVNVDILEHTKEELLKIIQEIKQKTEQNDFDRKINKSCMYCSVRKFCEQ